MAGMNDKTQNFVKMETTPMMQPMMTMDTSYHHNQYIYENPHANMESGQYANMMNFVSAPASAISVTIPEYKDVPQIVSVESSIHENQQNIERIAVMQRELFNNPNQENYATLLQQEEVLRNNIISQQNQLNNLKCSEVLGPSQRQMVKHCLISLKVQLEQVELYLEEIQTLVKPSNNIFAKLVYIHDPFPNVFMQKKEDTIVLKLLLGVTCFPHAYSNVQLVDTILANPLNSKKGVKPLPAMKVDNFPLEFNSLTCTYNCFFERGTRKDIATASFGIELQINEMVFQIKSEESTPFVVITNEKQFAASMGKLFISDVFKSNELPWIYVANEISTYFLLATRQDLSNPTRGLSVNEINYLHHKHFNGEPMVNVNRWKTFWEWFGEVLRVLRYTRHYGQLWNTGYIYGFLDHSIVMQCLDKAPQMGCALIRFSSNGGCLAIGFRNDTNSGQRNMKNLLVKPDDIKGTNFADFLRNKPIRYVLQFTGQFGEDSLPIFNCYPKDIALQEYYSVQNRDAAVRGYDPWSEINQ
eukprot:TRINITY_DN11316_c0_g1_i2.p1 TRINITY_DN11316_c0_g1~~TRINITY_DN11316_c0_g1_i2.p1  ORF type:complete len:583 (-),score=108.39 TRINITY_DN11316_c0_g1_i2:20-1603(-)